MEDDITLLKLSPEEISVLNTIAHQGLHTDNLMDEQVFDIVANLFELGLVEYIHPKTKTPIWSKGEIFVVITDRGAAILNDIQKNG